jgi:hypothetical protein
MLTLTFVAILAVALLSPLSGRSPSDERGKLAMLLDSRGMVVAVFVITFVVHLVRLGSAESDSRHPRRDGVRAPVGDLRARQVGAPVAADAVVLGAAARVGRADALVPSIFPAIRS